MTSLGKVTLEGGVWKIEAEPHVMVKLKRVFGKIARSSHGVVSLSATDENARDLLWFLDRYPMDVEAQKELEKRAARERLRQASIEEVFAPGYEPASFELAIPARRYQRLAADLLLRSHGLLLADDVGLGKTASAICTFADRRTLPAVVVTLTHLPRQWEDEIAKFAPSLRVHVVKKGTPYTISKEGERSPDVVVLNYHKLSGWADVLGARCESVVFDEVQELRHAGTAKYQAALHLARNARFRIGLSATPIYNYGGEIFSVIDVLRPGALGSHEEFLREWCTHEEPPRIMDPRSFGTFVRSNGLMLRRTRAEVGRELPSLTKVPHHVEADPEVLDRISGSAAELAQIILRQREDRRGERWEASEEFSSILRQATGIAKAPFVADFARLLVESGERVVLFGWHREVYGIWRDRLADLDPAMYTGSETASRKDEARRRFVDGETPILIMSLRSGAGLDGLQGSSRTVVFGELDWSPGVHEQCVGRVHRDGQKDPVVAYFLVADRGADPTIADVLQLKKQQSDGVRDPKGELLERLDVGGRNVRRLAEEYLRQRNLLAADDSISRIA